MKTIDDYFADWEAHVFGIGYGTGEKPILGALKTFLETCAEDGCYSYKDLESACGATVAWLLITILVRADVIEYGSSPRFGWLDTNGKALRDYVRGRDVDTLFDVVYRDQDYVHCYPDRCQCDDGRCANPFWSRYASAKDGGA